MKERPILFSGPMVRAILDGRKTQTRRAVKPQPHSKDVAFTASKKWPNHWYLHAIGGSPTQDFIGEFRCPYGQPGDRLWVRERCRAEELESGLDGVRYDADNHFRPIENSQEASDRWVHLYHYGKGKGKTVPSVHMPRWACRIVADIVSVRVERLQDISHEDAIAEGVEPVGNGWRNYLDSDRPFLDPIHSFRSLWQSINGLDSWDMNPWDWVVEFERVLEGN